VLKNWRPAISAKGSVFAEIRVSWWKRERLTAYQIGVLSLIVPSWFHRERPQTIPILPPDMAELETVFHLGTEALLEISEFTILKNMLRRAVRPLRMAVAVLRRVRQTLFTPFLSLGRAR
jgi:hypothetical protein